MIRGRHLLLGACMLGVAGCGQAAITAETATTDGASAGIEMNAETQARMGVRTSSMAASTSARTVEGYARVMDVGPLAAIESEVSAAYAAAAASQEEYRRLQALAAQDQAASARSVEAARAQAAADTARAKLAGRRIGLEWGAGLEKMSDGERSRLLTDIASGRAALVRIDAPSANAEVTHASLLPDKNGGLIEASLIGRAAAADARLQTSGLLAVVRGANAASLTAGRLAPARLELGASENGILIPDGALLRAEGEVLVYVQTGADRFERREVTAGRAVAGGWFVVEGVKAGDEVVTEGAASLLAAEAGPVEAE